MHPHAFSRIGPADHAALERRIDENLISFTAVAIGLDRPLYIGVDRPPGPFPLLSEAR